MTHRIDACGLTCPAPVLLVKDAVERLSPPEITVLVDNEPSCENVTRFLHSKGYVATVTRENQVYKLQACCREGGSIAAPEMAARKADNPAAQKILVLVANDRLGTGDQALGQKLMISFLKTLKEMGNELWQLIFINGGVRLTTSTSPVLAELQEYERSGVTVLACGTCLEHFGLTAEKAVGSATNMLDIITAMQLADKVVTMS